MKNIHDYRDIPFRLFHFFRNMYYCVCANERIPMQPFSSRSRLLLKLMIYMAFDMPMVQATPIPQPLVPMCGVVMEESGCLCWLRATTRPKTTKKPIKDKAKLAWITLGTCRGPRKSGRTVAVLIIYHLLSVPKVLASKNNCCQVHHIQLRLRGLKIAIPKRCHSRNRCYYDGNSRTSCYGPA